MKTGKPVVGPILPRGGVWPGPIIVLRVPVFLNGAVAYVLSASIGPDGIATIMHRHEATADTLITVYDRQLHIVSRSDGDRYVAQSAPETIRRRAASGASGLFSDTTLDGTEYMRVLVTSTLTGWSVAVGTSRDSFDRVVTVDVLRLTGIGSLAMLIACIGVLILGRRAERHATDDIRTANRNLALANEKADERASRAERLQADLAAVMDAVPVVVNIARDPECRTIVGNRFADTFFGVTREANVSLSALDDKRIVPFRVFRNGEEIAPRDLPLQRAARGMEVRDWECDLVFQDGTVKTIVGSASPLRSPDGTLCGSVGAFLDVTERKRLEADLHAQRERLQLFIDGAPAGIAMFDGEMRYIAVSQRFASDYGVASDDLVGRNHYDVFPEITERWRDIHRRCLGGETIRCEEEPFPRADGHIDWVRWEIRPWYSEPDRIGGIILFAENITERKAIESDLHAAKVLAEQANDAKTRFLASVSHDLRQPLQAQRFLLFSVQRKATDPDQTRTFAQIEKTLDATETMLSRLMDFAALESGNVQVKREVFRLDLFVRDIVRENDDEAERKGLAIGVRLIPCWTESDPVLLDRIVRNLITNALRYTEKGGVLVGIRRRGTNLRIEVRDTGKGIPPDQQQVIFEEFRQLDNPERNRTKGHGLGLAIVAKTAELLGHRLFLRSMPGRGSLFAVEVARTDEPERNKESASLSIVSPAHALTVLVVEDDPVQAEALGAVLTDCGYRVVIACDPAEAMAARPIPDLIISDYRLAGGLTGLGVVECIREASNKPIPALIMTGDTQAAIALDVARMGCSIIYKPCAPSLFMASIARVMTVGNG